MITAKEFREGGETAVQEWQSKVHTAQGIVIEQLKEKLGNDAHLLDRLIATRGKNKGFLKSTPPKWGTEEDALHQAIMMEANPYKVSIGRVFFMNDEERIKHKKYGEMLSGMKGILLLCKDRVTLEMLGAY